MSGSKVNARSKARVNAVPQPSEAMMWLMAAGQDLGKCPLCGRETPLNQYACDYCREEYGVEACNSAIKESKAEKAMFLEVLGKISRCNAEEVIQAELDAIGDYSPVPADLPEGVKLCPFHGHPDAEDCMGGRMPVPDWLGGGNQPVCSACYGRIMFKAGYCRSCHFPLEEGHPHENCPHCFDVWQAGGGFPGDEGKKKAFVQGWLARTQPGEYTLGESRVGKLYRLLWVIARSAFIAQRYSLAYSVLRHSEKYLVKAEELAADQPQEPVQVELDTGAEEVAVLAPEEDEEPVSEPELPEPMVQGVMCSMCGEKPAAYGTYNGNRGPWAGSIKLGLLKNAQLYEKHINKPHCKKCLALLAQGLEADPDVDKLEGEVFDLAKADLIRVAHRCPGYREECGAWTTGALCSTCWQWKQEEEAGLAGIRARLTTLLKEYKGAYQGWDNEDRQGWLPGLDIQETLKPLDKLLEARKLDEAEALAREIASRVSAEAFAAQREVFDAAKKAFGGAPDYVQERVDEAVKMAESGEYLEAAQLMDPEAERARVVLGVLELEQKIREVASAAKGLLERTRYEMATPDLSQRAGYAAKILKLESGGAQLPTLQKNLETTLKRAYDDAFEPLQRFDYEEVVELRRVAGMLVSSKVKGEDGKPHPRTVTLEDRLKGIELLLDAARKAYSIREAEVAEGQLVAAFVERDRARQLEASEAGESGPSRGEQERERNDATAERALEEAQQQMEARNGANGSSRGETVVRGGRARRVRGGAGSDDEIIAQHLDAYSRSIVAD